MNYTKNCIIPGCNKKAKLHTGHVHSHGAEILAGFCEKHKNEYKTFISGSEHNNCTGCFGDLKLTESEIISRNL